MINYNKHITSVLVMASLIVSAVLTSCSGQEDFHYDVDGHYAPDYGDTISVIRSHTEGEGFPIIIMADGYTSEDIANGTYRKATLRTDTAIFSMEPMKSLKQYFDIIEVAVPSKESGITTKKKDTYFKTYYASGGNTEIYGDSIKVLTWISKALQYAYNIQQEQALSAKLKKSQGVVLLNCLAYKGITLLSYDNTVTDSIPSGYSLSYIPADARVNQRNVFADLVQHEVVGHGIGKLTDEYFTPSMSSPTPYDIEEFHTMQKYGFAANASYDTEATSDIYACYLEYDRKKLSILAHAFYPTDAAYPLTTDPLYADEDIAWYQGGHTFLTYTNEPGEKPGELGCKKNFYRASRYSTMNSTTDPVNKTFNAVSRLAIYKRVKRAALGPAFSCHLTNANDLKAFTDFDAAGREERAKAFPKTTGNAKGMKASALPVYIMSLDEPRLPSPRIINTTK